MKLFYTSATAKAEIAELEGKIATLESNSTADAAEIERLTADLATANESIATLTADLDEAASALETTEQSLSTAEAKIATLEKDVADAKASSGQQAIELLASAGQEAPLAEVGHSPIQVDLLAQYAALQGQAKRDFLAKHGPELQSLAKAKG